MYCPQHCHRLPRTRVSVRTEDINMLQFLALFALCWTVQAGRLQVQGKHFVKDGQRVFLSGSNLAWLDYAHDFGNHQYSGVKTRMEDYFKQLHDAGGNSVRLWIHIEGETSPNFDQNGYVTGLDRDGTFLKDMKDMLSAAAKNNILVFPTLWNSAVNQKYHYRLHGLIVDTRKLQSYIDHALIPMVRALANMPALGGWDIINEPEGEIIPGSHNSDPCFDTQHLQGSGAGWAGKLYSYQDMLRFINWQAAAIRSVDPQALVTVGNWNPKASTDQFGQHNHYSDHCLVKAGGKTQGTLSFYQIHSYSWHGSFDNVSPFKHGASSYHLDKPVVVGEFMESEGGGMSISQLFHFVYDHGYQGAWCWPGGHSQDSWSKQRAGIASIRHSTSNGAVAFTL